jgi:hypothetical protein
MSYVHTAGGADFRFPDLKDVLTDAQRDCAGANRLIWLLRECQRLQLTGVLLKDRSDLLKATLTR